MTTEQEYPLRVSPEKYQKLCTSLCFYLFCEFDKKVCDNSFPSLQEKVFFTLALPFLHAILEL